MRDEGDNTCAMKATTCAQQRQQHTHDEGNNMRTAKAITRA
jgi:hypothetical protein